MMRSTTAVLSEKRGLAAALGFSGFAVAMLLVAASLVTSYAYNSRQTEQLVGVGVEIQNRAEAYTSALNADLTAVQVPSMARECSNTTKNCTQILTATPSADGSTMVLRIQGDTQAALGQSLTQDVVLRQEAVTHVTAINDDGSNVWGRSSEGLQFKTWSVAEGKPSDVNAADLVHGASWVSVDDRAGIDSAGGLWVWGANDLGQAGTGSASSDPIKPKHLDIDGVTFRTVVTDDNRGYAIDSRGFAWVWGKNDKGQLGLPADAPSVVQSPTKITGQRFVSFAVGKDSTYAISTSGQLLAAGLPQGGLYTIGSPGWNDISSGTRYQAVAASTLGAVATIDSSGKLNVVGSSYPFTPLAGGVFTDVSLGTNTGYAIGTNGRIYSFGQDSTGQLGLGATTSASTPTATQLPKFVSVQGSKTGAFAIDTSGALYYTGKAPAGFYAGGYLPQVNVFTKILPGTQFRQVAANTGDLAAAILDTSGNIYGLGTPTAGLWPMSYSGPSNQPIRMPVPDGFASYTWQNH